MEAQPEAFLEMSEELAKELGVKKGNPGQGRVDKR